MKELEFVRLSDVKNIARQMGVRRFWRPKPVPTNLQRHDTSPHAIEKAAEYGLSCGRQYLQHMRSLNIETNGAHVIEIGPGVAFGAMAYLRAHGAIVGVADRWLADWQDDFHNPYYKLLADGIKADNASAEVSFFDEMAAAKGYCPNSIQLYPSAAESIAQIEDKSVDVIFSNAVLEHISHPQNAFAEFHRITRPGGYGAHQVDFRDHRDFSRPLDHLLLPAKQFERLSELVNTEYGSQRRQSEYAALLKESGFDIIQYDSNDRADPSYLETFTPRLRAAKNSDYAGASREDLADLGGLYIVRRRNLS